MRMGPAPATAPATAPETVDIVNVKSGSQGDEVQNRTGARLLDISNTHHSTCVRTRATTTALLIVRSPYCVRLQQATVGIEGKQR
jgi:hypothetical protein